jgi:carbonic anhydrase/acetyltransferase-like protein (isoleucine patch superfamily)
MLYLFDNKRPRVGTDSYVSEHALVIGDVLIGDNCYIGHGAILRGDYGSITIGNASAVEEGVVVHAPPRDVCRIGNRVTMGHGAIIHAAQIGDDTVIGMGAILSIRSVVSDDSIVAEGSVVTMNQVIPPGVVVGGSPARVLREVTPKDREYWGAAKTLYVDLAKKYLALGMEEVRNG